MRGQHWSKLGLRLRKRGLQPRRRTLERSRRGDDTSVEKSVAYKHVFLILGPTENDIKEPKSVFVFEKQKNTILVDGSEETVVLLIVLKGRVWFLTLML